MTKQCPSCDEEGLRNRDDPSKAEFHCTNPDCDVDTFRVVAE